MISHAQKITEPRETENVIKGAERYTNTKDLWIISCYYNPSAYQSKPTNYDIFIEKIEEAGINYVVVECAFGKQPFTLKRSKNIIQIRTTDIMWHKERLLNIALEKLPLSCKKVAWVDCDVLFENPDWAVETVGMLKHYKVLQPFHEAIRLPKNATFYSGSGERYYSFGHRLISNPNLVVEGRYDEHGHTGFAWAAHTSILKKHGFYDACIAGTADHVMAHAFVGDWDTSCVKRVFGVNEYHYKHYLEWAKTIYPKVNSKLASVPGTLLHLWHGDVADRKYSERERILQQFGFDPAKDIVINKNKCWNWNNNNKALKKWAKEYFVLRKED